MKFILALTFLCSATFAGDVSQEPKFLVKSVDGTDLKSLAAPNVKVLPPHRKVAQAGHLPSVADRDRIFQESGLTPQLKDWDDFDKDSLYIKLQKKGQSAIDRILVKHPELNRDTLEKAQKQIEKEEAP